MRTLPAGWREATLGEVVVDAQPGFASGSHAADGDILHLRPMNITPDGRLDTDTGKFVTTSAGALRTVFGDVLFNNTNSLRWVGKTAFVDSTEPLAFSNHMTRLRVSDRLDARFLALYLHFRQESGFFERIASNHVNQASVATKRLMQIDVVVPPLDEQRRIVAILEDHLAHLDGACNALARAVADAQAMALHQISGLVRRAVLSCPMTTVGQQAVLIQYGTSQKTAPQTSNADIPVLRMGNLQDGRVVWDNLKYLPPASEGLGDLMLVDGDLLFNRTNSLELVGKSAVFEAGPRASFASYLIRVRFGAAALPQWASMTINSPFGREYVRRVASQQVGQANVNGTKLKAFPLPLPSINDQRRFVDTYQQTVDARVRVEELVETASARAITLRRSLLAAAFRGDLTRDFREDD